ncbi:uncharacterized protein LOC143591257 [Bidens hawaiensis]|uniref:uncharacterized protein LOC143591257 n=1 Tax=Bidens hawaiensis TaxID=980011 RepID=UPI004049888F
MDVFSLLNFWRNAGVGHPITTQQLDFDFTINDDNSFFDLVFTNTDDVIFSNNKRKVMPLDSSNTKSPFRALKLGFHYYNNNNNNNNNKSRSDKKKMKREVELEHVSISSLLKSSEPSKRFSKDVVHKYLNLIKPLYVKVSRTSSELCSRKNGKPTVFKRLGKSRSSSSSSAGKVTPAPAARRSSDSDLQQDGIQSAILHCKKSYGSPSGYCDVLSRSGSAPYQESWICIEEMKRSSI